MLEALSIVCFGLISDHFTRQTNLVEMFGFLLLFGVRKLKKNLEKNKK